MNTRETVANRIRALCGERGWTPNRLATISAVPQATIKSILNGESANPGVVTIKKLCDGFGITLGEFFDDPSFNELEQEIR
jgi:transcriptional regulator with XRE-family HTH domain